MPSTTCCVPLCSNRGGHSFPKDESRRNLWIKALKRSSDSSAGAKLWTPTPSSVVCKQHFVPDDYITETVYGENVYFTVYWSKPNVSENMNMGLLHTVVVGEWGRGLVWTPTPS